MQFHWGLTLPLWGWICKWNTNELKVFSLWELINRGAPLLHIYIFFLKSSQGSPVTNYGALAGQLHWTSAPLSSCEHHTCIFAPLFHFLKGARGRGLLQGEEAGVRGRTRAVRNAGKQTDRRGWRCRLWPSLGKGGQVHLLRAFFMKTLFTTLICWRYPAHWNQNGLQGQTKNKKHFTICEWCFLILFLPSPPSPSLYWQTRQKKVNS